MFRLKRKRYTEEKKFSDDPLRQRYLELFNTYEPFRSGKLPKEIWNYAAYCCEHFFLKGVKYGITSLAAKKSEALSQVSAAQDKKESRSRPRSGKLAKRIAFHRRGSR